MPSNVEKELQCEICGVVFITKSQRTHHCSPTCLVWKYVDQRTKLECWPWRASKNKDGYGRLAKPGGGTDLFAHRLVYEYINGPIPETLRVCHTCDNSSCCNPEHLFLGTQLENMIDMLAKGRGGRSALTERQVLEIRTSSLSRKQLGEKFRVGRGTIDNIINRKSWRWL